MLLKAQRRSFQSAPCTYINQLFLIQWFGAVHMVFARGEAHGKWYRRYVYACTGQIIVPGTC